MRPILNVNDLPPSWRQSVVAKNASMVNGLNKKQTLGPKKNNENRLLWFFCWVLIGYIFYGIFSGFSAVWQFQQAKQIMGNQYILMAQTECYQGIAYEVYWTGSTGALMLPKMDADAMALDCSNFKPSTWGIKNGEASVSGSGVQVANQNAVGNASSESLVDASKTKVLAGIDSVNQGLSDLFDVHNKEKLDIAVSNNKYPESWDVMKKKLTPVCKNKKTYLSYKPEAFEKFTVIVGLMYDEKTHMVKSCTG